MKKILVLLLAAIMVLSVSACTSKEPAQNPHPSEPNTENVESTYQEPEWETRAMERPNVDITVKYITYGALGEARHDVLLVSPLSYDKYNPETALNALKEDALLQGWDITLSHIESSKPVVTDNGQLTAYAYDTVITLMELSEDAYTGRMIEVRYTRDTDECADGYTVISLRFGAHENEFTQTQVFNIAKIVYGEYAEYLCYAQMSDDGGASTSITTRDGCVTLSRSLLSGNISFEIGCMNTNESATDGYDGDYQPKKYSFETLNLLGLSEQEYNFNNMQQFAKSFLERYYGKGAYLIADPTGGYTYSFDEFSDGNTCEMTLVYGDVYIEEELIAKHVAFQHTAWNDADEVYFCFNLPQVMSYDVTEATEAEMYQQASEIAKAILKQDVDFEANEAYELTLDGKPAYFTCTYSYTIDEQGNAYACLTVSASTAEDAETEV